MSDFPLCQLAVRTCR